MARPHNRLRRDQVLTRRFYVAVAAVLAAEAATLVFAAPASAHVVPSTAIALNVHQDTITAVVTLPTYDLETASGLDIPTSGTISDATASKVDSYLEKHFVVRSGGRPWSVDAETIRLRKTSQWGTGVFPAVTATVLLAPPDTASLRSFTLDYDAIIHKVITADIVVTLNSDWAAGHVESARNLGTITLDTVTGKIPTLAVNLDDGSLWRGFTGMVGLGVSHIAAGTDHQLFLLTLLLPAPLMAARKRWAGVVPPRRAVRRITAITLAFTIGHSITLALGTLGVPVPQQPVEALIAVSILIAAAHAIRPLFPGREPLIAGLFGLVHGMAFSATLSSLDLSGPQLGLSLLGFNLGIEIMQLTVVLLVLPPLVILATTRVYRPLRLTAAALTGVAATGWVIDRAGAPNVIGAAADTLGTASPWIVATLWAAAIAVVIRHCSFGSRDNMGSMEAS